MNEKVSERELIKVKLSERLKETEKKKKKKRKKFSGLPKLNLNGIDGPVELL